MATALLTAGLIGVAALPAAADPSGEPQPPKAGEDVCSISDQRLSTLVGLAADGDGYWAVADGSVNMSQLDVIQLDGSCKVKKTVTAYRGGGPADPVDPQDLAIDKDGRLWVADFADPAKTRDRIALWRVDPKDPNKSELYRLTYPGGEKHDSTALLLTPDGKPLVVTKDARSAVLFAPTGELKDGQTVELKEAGKFEFKATDTPGGPIGPPGQVVATGAAVSADGSKAVIRTYTDAYEWNVTGGDVAKAITGGAPLRTALPDEAVGEAIAYKDGKFVTGSQDEGSGAALRSYDPVVPETPKAESKDEGDSRSFFDKLTLDQIIWIIVGVGIVGLVLAGVGVFVIVRSRKARAAAAAKPSGQAEDAIDDHLRGRRGGPRDEEDPRERGFGPPRERVQEERGFAPPPQDRPGYREEPYRAPDRRYGPPEPRPAAEPRPDRRPPSPRPGGGGAVYGGGGNYEREPHRREDDARPDFGIPDDRR
ncbi:hypothetical protein Afil01_38520 [Actinorhabdospora filicis]|uniref:Uncharacterized protein n=1 Tax=Actinorhabdospora filicis TaxID=1785913 RepID=A0A9W6SL94_9ACTN|nr:hypothetical protein Afil01_38520 [Actinorhabdospora filicis]